MHILPDIDIGYELIDKIKIIVFVENDNYHFNGMLASCSKKEKPNNYAVVFLNVKFFSNDIKNKIAIRGILSHELRHFEDTVDRYAIDGEGTSI